MTTLSKLDEQIQKQIDALLNKEEEASTAAEKLLVLVTDYYIECEETNKPFTKLVPLNNLQRAQRESYKRAAKVAATYRLTQSGTGQKREIPFSINALEELDRQTDDVDTDDYEAKRTVKRKLFAEKESKGASLTAKDIRKLFKSSVAIVKPRRKTRKTTTMDSRLKKNYVGYSLLGLSEENPQDVINIVYKHWSHKYHPDKGGSHDDFIKIQEAFEVVNCDK